MKYTQQPNTQYRPTDLQRTPKLRTTRTNKIDGSLQTTTTKAKTIIECTQYTKPNQWSKKTNKLIIKISKDRESVTEQRNEQIKRTRANIKPSWEPGNWETKTLEKHN